MDSKWTVLNKMFWIEGTNEQWNNGVQFYLGGLNHTAGDLLDLAYIRVWFLNKSDSYASGDLYLDNFKLVKGSTYTAGHVTNNFNDFKCVSLSINDFKTMKQAYFEIKAEGTGSFKFMLESENWKNISGDTTITITDGVPSGSTVLYVQELEDGWYGIAIELEGDGIDDAPALNMFYLDSITDLSSVSVDLNSLTPFNSNVLSSQENIEFKKKIDISSLDDDGTKALQFKVKAIPEAGFTPEGDDKIKLGYQIHGGKEADGTGWINYTGWCNMFFNVDGTLNEITIPNGAADRTAKITQLEDGWSLISLTRKNFVYPHGEQPGDDKLKVFETKTFSHLVKVYLDFYDYAIVDVE